MSDYGGAMEFDRVEKEIWQKMERRGLRAGAIGLFLRMVRQAKEDESAYVPLDSVSPPDSKLILNTPPDAVEVAELEARGRELLSQAVMIKLNGGRSTTMGGDVPKGTLIAKDGRSYLEIIAGQVKAFDTKWNVNVPLVLMDSFFTHEPTLEVTSRFDIPVRTFVQNQVPRLVENSFQPLETGSDDDWVPPGHGDVYASLSSSGLLDRLIAEGRRIAFISNLDNLAASLEPWILGLIERERIDFLMEVTDRTEVDRKGGTLIVRDDHLDLLEIAQVAAEERDRFMDINQFRVFNTNNMWVDLEALSSAINRQALKLPIIQNRKTVDGVSIVQLETAMGAAIGSFPGARGLRVGRERFFPTKKVEDLFLLQSDACVLDSMDRLQRNPRRPPDLSLRPMVIFSPDFLDSPIKMHLRFEDPSTVSLVRAVSFEVRGAVFFEREVKIEGEVVVEGSGGEILRIGRGTVLADGKYP
ncbi:MAG: UTP--glucose-1-phosphate uridylyltransferase [Deltaproteobacteria bacterium]